jgi:hypothetical protein
MRKPCNQAPHRPPISRHDFAALGDGCARRGEAMQGTVTFLLALAIMILAGLGVTLIHYNSLWSDSLGIGMAVFALVGAFMLYRIFFWHE